MINKIMPIILTILFSPLLIIMACLYVLSPDDEEAIIQGIGKGYTVFDLEKKLKTKGKNESIH